MDGAAGADGWRCGGNLPGREEALLSAGRAGLLPPPPPPPPPPFLLHLMNINNANGKKKITAILISTVALQDTTNEPHMRKEGKGADVLIMKLERI